MAEKDVTRRSFLEKLLIASGVVSTGVIAGSTYVALKGDDAADIVGEAADELLPSSFSPAQTVTTQEISRHAGELPRNADGAKEVHFTIQEHTAEVVPGATMAYWTFDGRVPGPMVRARLGDTLHFFLHNPAESGLPHNVDFHAVNGPGGGAAHLATAPGETSEIKFRLMNPGIFIYHCAFPDIPMHISHGMYGLIVVEPEGGLPQVDHEFYLMQSELYTDKGGRQQYVQLQDGGHLEYSAEYGRMEQPTFVVWNGRPESCMHERALGADQSIQVGQTVRLFVGNIGPNHASSFHVIGEIFDRVYVEGSFDLVNRNVQSTLIPAGGAAGVEFKVDYPGDYTIVDHSIFRIHKGAIGVLHVEGTADPSVVEPIKYNTQLSGGH
jgi:nitrite reductase (NO-forming)